MLRPNALRKSQRLCSHRLIDTLFEAGRSKSFSAFPLRAVFCTRSRAEQQENQILVSVPKRYFKHAVDRNRVKRQVREAYRTQQALLTPQADTTLAIAFIWLDNKHHTSQEVAAKVRNLLQRISETQCVKS